MLAEQAVEHGLLLAKGLLDRDGQGVAVEPLDRDKGDTAVGIAEGDLGA